MRRTLLLLVVALLLLSCAGDGTGPGTRTLDSVLPHLTRSLTPQRAELVLGPPDERTEGEVILYVYRVEAGRSVRLGFPGYAPILYARLRLPSGEERELPLAD